MRPFALGQMHSRGFTHLVISIQQVLAPICHLFVSELLLCTPGDWVVLVVTTEGLVSTVTVSSAPGAGGQTRGVWYEDPAVMEVTVSLRKTGHLHKTVNNELWLVY